MARLLCCGRCIVWPVLALLLFAPSHASYADGTSREAGDLTKLSCELKHLPRAGDADQVAVVQVANRGKLTAEPLAFEFRIPGARRDVPPQTVRVRRMPEPDEGRRGRAVRPGKRLTYWLPVVATAEPSRAATVSVTRASFFDGVGVPDVPVRVVKRTVRKVKDSLGRTRKQAVHTLENRLDKPVDLIVRTTYARPKGLSYVRLLQIGAGDRLVWNGDAEPGGLRIAAFGKYSESLIQKLKVLDWSVVEGGDPAAAKDTPTELPVAIDRTPRKPAPDIPVLRAAWNRHYRYPAEPIDLSGRFTIAAPNTSIDWRGHAELVGTFAFRGYTGTPAAETRLVYKKADVTIVGAAGDGDKAAMASLFEARYTIWTRQDPETLPRYDVAFAGATLTPDPDEAGVWRLSAGPWRAVHVDDGHLSMIELADGTARSFSWRRHDGVLLASAIRNRGPGDQASELHVTWEKLKSGRRVPRELRIEGWFGAGWGPETFTFHRLREALE